MPGKEDKVNATLAIEGGVLSVTKVSGQMSSDAFKRRLGLPSASHQ